jgi:hypothetical protein
LAQYRHREVRAERRAKGDGQLAATTMADDAASKLRHKRGIAAKNHTVVSPKCMQVQ